MHSLNTAFKFGASLCVSSLLHPMSYNTYGNSYDHLEISTVPSSETKNKVNLTCAIIAELSIPIIGSDYRCRYHRFNAKLNK